VGLGYSLRLEATVCTCTVHPNLGPWVPGPLVLGQLNIVSLHTAAIRHRPMHGTRVSLGYSLRLKATVRYMHSACQFGSLGPRSPSPGSTEYSVPSATAYSCFGLVGAVCCDIVHLYCIHGILPWQHT